MSEKINIKKINYNSKSLRAVQKKVEKEITELKKAKTVDFKSTVISVDGINGKVILEVENNIDKAIEYFQNTYGELLEIKAIEPGNAPVQEIERLRDWTKLGEVLE